MKIFKFVLSLAPLAILGMGCASQPLKFPTVEKVNQTHYDVLGKGKGEATGLMLFQFIPIGQNERYVKALWEPKTS